MSPSLRKGSASRAKRGRAPRAARRAGSRSTAGTLQRRLAKYVDVILDVGLNLRPGQRLLIVNNLLNGVDVSLAPFVRLVAEAAYRRGAPLVDVIWGDEQLELMRLRKAPPESLSQYPKWPAAARLEHAEESNAYLALRGNDPNLLAKIDPVLVGQYLAAIREPLKPVMPYMFRNSANWCVAAVSTPPWAATVLPRVPEARRVARLWELILETCRLGDGDAVSNWRQHIADLAARKDYLNRKQYAWLQYSAPGTRLKIGLPPGHIWNGGQMTAENGVPFVPNLPTEEVFTLPHRAHVEGEVASTKPLIYNGQTIDGMHLTFEAGKVIKASARRGQGMLEQLLKADEGASHLGEVALVPHSSPISRLGVTFHSTLFDENAACHLAFGEAYRFTLKDAEPMSEEAFGQAGGNVSQVHSDFMVGSGKLDIDGLRQDGRAESVMRSGEWAFDV
jgi:aminopeptidase